MSQPNNQASEQVNTYSVDPAEQAGQRPGTSSVVNSGVGESRSPLAPSSEMDEAIEMIKAIVGSDKFKKMDDSRKTLLTTVVNLLTTKKDISEQKAKLVLETALTSGMMFFQEAATTYEEFQKHQEKRFKAGEALARKWLNDLEGLEKKIKHTNVQLSNDLQAIADDRRDFQGNEWERYQFNLKKLKIVLIEYVTLIESNIKPEIDQLKKDRTNHLLKICFLVVLAWLVILCLMMWLTSKVPYFEPNFDTVFVTVLLGSIFFFYYAYCAYLPEPDYILIKLEKELKYYEAYKDIFDRKLKDMSALDMPQYVRAFKRSVEAVH